MTKSKRAASLFGEWQIMQDNVNAFAHEITKRLRTEGYKRIRVFAVGSPRNFRVVVRAERKGLRSFKRFDRDIRDESYQFWLEHWDACKWEEYNHIIGDLEF